MQKEMTTADFRAKLEALMPVSGQRGLMTAAFDKLIAGIKDRGFEQDAIAASLLRAAVEEMIVRYGAQSTAMMLTGVAELIVDEYDTEKKH